jgi:hypothetical protein
MNGTKLWSLFPGDCGEQRPQHKCELQAVHRASSHLLSVLKEYLLGELGSLQRP